MQQTYPHHQSRAFCIPVFIFFFVFVCDVLSFLAAEEKRFFRGGGNILREFFHTHTHNDYSLLLAQYAAHTHTSHPEEIKALETICKNLRDSAAKK